MDRIGNLNPFIPYYILNGVGVQDGLAVEIQAKNRDLLRNEKQSFKNG